MHYYISYLSFLPFDLWVVAVGQLGPLYFQLVHQAFLQEGFSLDLERRLESLMGQVHAGRVVQPCKTHRRPYHRTRQSHPRCEMIVQLRHRHLGIIPGKFNYEKNKDPR